MLTGGRLTLEDAYAYAKFARVALAATTSTCGPRPHSAEEPSSSRHVAGRDIEVSYADLERAPAVLLAGFEPQDESPIVFLRLRKAVRAGTLAVLLHRCAGQPRAGEVSTACCCPPCPARRPALTALPTRPA